MEKEKTKEYISEKLGVPYVVVYKDGEKIFLCNNGVAFNKTEYLEKFYSKEKLQEEYERRKENDQLYDYSYARTTGILRKKRAEPSVEIEDCAPRVSETPVAEYEAKESTVSKAVRVMCLLLGITTVGSMYISTVHTATYLFDYVDMLSAWIMSFVITVYCSTAFEVVVLFHEKRRHVLSAVFALLWSVVVVFSMATTVSVFYDRYNFNAVQDSERNDAVDSARLSLELLQKKEQALREAIKEKQADMDYRREREWATTAVRSELNKLQDELQACLEEQKQTVKEAPKAVQEEAVKKETLFAFLGRLMGMDGGLLEFVMSTLSAIFINLISPFSVTVVVSLLNGKERDYESS